MHINIHMCIINEFSLRILKVFGITHDVYVIIKGVQKPSTRPIRPLSWLATGYRPLSESKPKYL